MISVNRLALLLSGLLVATMLALGLSGVAAAKPAPKVTVGVSPHVLTEGGIVTVSGRVRGLPRGAKVVAQRRTTSGWESLQTGKTKATGKFSLRVRPPVGASQLRVRVPQTRRTRAVSSKSVSVTVNRKMSVTTDPGGSFKVVSRGINGSYPYGEADQPDPRQDGGRGRVLGISADGKAVIFGSTGSNLVAGADPPGVGFDSREDLFLWRDDEVKALYQGNGIDPSVQVQVSDNGVWATYAEFGESEPALTLVNTVTGARTVLPLKAPDDSEGAIPSDDGQTIAFTYGEATPANLLPGGVYLYRRGTDEYQQVSSGQLRLVGMSADASRLLMATSSGERQYLWDARSNQIRVVGGPVDPRTAQLNGSLSGNGRFVVFQNFSRLSPLGAQVRLLDVETGLIRQVATPPGLGDTYFIDDLQVSDDGSFLTLIIRTQRQADGPSLWALDLGRSTFRRVSQSPDGSSSLASKAHAIAFSSYPGLADHVPGGAALYVADVSQPPPFEVSVAPDRVNLRLGQSVTFSGVVEGLTNEATVLLQFRRGTSDAGDYWTDVAEGRTDDDGSFTLTTTPIPGSGYFRVLKPRSATRSAGLSETQIVTPYADPAPQTGPIRLASISQFGGIANAGGSRSDISGDGRFVAFWSGASDLVAGDDNHLRDLFLRDSVLGTTQRITDDRDRPCRLQCSSEFNPAISRDGRFVAYASTTPASADAPLDKVFELRLWDRVTGSTTRIAGPGFYSSIDVVNGGAVAYRVPGSNSQRLFLWTRADGQSRQIGSAAGGLAISTNGAFIAYGDGENVYRLTRATGVKQLVSHTPEGLGGDGASGDPRISDDGSTIVFASLASDLTTGSAQRGTGYFLWNAGTDTVTAIEPPETASDLTGKVTMVDLSGDGSTVLFNVGGAIFGAEEPEDGLVAWRGEDGTFTPVSQDVQGNYVSATSGSLSFDGKRASVDSSAPNLVSGDPPAVPAYGTNTAYPLRDIFTWTAP